jgi:hypothetical protein
MSQYARAEVTAAAKVNMNFIVHRERASLLKKRQKGPVEEKLGWVKDSRYK